MLRVRVEAIKGHRMALPVGLVCKSTAIIAMEAKTGRNVIRKQKRSSENKEKGSSENKGGTCHMKATEIIL